MNHSFEYIDIILLAMIAGFIFLRLRGILGRRTGNEKNLDAKFSSNFQAEKILKEVNKKLNAKVVTKISKEKNYCKAEEYHQKYFQKKSLK